MRAAAAAGGGEDRRGLAHSAADEGDDDRDEEGDEAEHAEHAQDDGEAGVLLGGRVWGRLEEKRAMISARRFCDREEDRCSHHLHTWCIRPGAPFSSDSAVGARAGAGEVCLSRDRGRIV